MAKSMEDFILEEIGRQHATNLDTKLAYFQQICKRLGIKQDRMAEISPMMREILQEETEEEPYH